MASASCQCVGSCSSQFQDEEKLAQSLSYLLWSHGTWGPALACPHPGAWGTRLACVPPHPGA